MDKLSRLSAQQRDDLIAYLDGELDEPMTQQVEQVLAQSNVARHEVDMLARTWDLLSVLPTPRASAGFTQKTLTLLMERPKSTPLSERQWFRTTKQVAVLASWAVGLVLAGCLGYMVTNKLASTEADLLVDDLPVIQSFHQYQEVDADIEFVRKLQETGKLSDESPAN